jgi:hypothetical protein
MRSTALTTTTTTKNDDLTPTASTPFSWMSTSRLLGLLTMIGIGAKGHEMCYCAPLKYTFTFDFALTCIPRNVTLNEGIFDLSCQVAPLCGPDDTDLVPVQVDFVDVFEFGQALSVISEVNIAGPFSDGDIFSYTSLVQRNKTLTEFPIRIQLSIVASNGAGESILNIWNIEFTNNCSAFPVLLEGESYGWTKFVSETTVDWLCHGYHTPILIILAAVEPNISRRLN